MGLTAVGRHCGSQSCSISLEVNERQAAVICISENRDRSSCNYGVLAANMLTAQRVTQKPPVKAIRVPPISINQKALVVSATGVFARL